MLLNQIIEGLNIAIRAALPEEETIKELYGLTFPTVKDTDLLNIREDTREAVEYSDRANLSIFYRITAPSVFEFIKGRGAGNLYKKLETITLVCFSDLPGIRDRLEAILARQEHIKLKTTDTDGERVYSLFFKQGEYDYRRQLFSITFTAKVDCNEKI